MRLTAGTNVPDDDFVRFLVDCDRSEYGVLEDVKFVSVIAEGALRGKSKIMQFLLGVNRHGRPDAVVLQESQCTVEHILPVSSDHWGNWRGFANADGRDWIHRIGNLTLMGSGDNKPGIKYNSSFARKRQSYEKSSVGITAGTGHVR